VSLPSLQSYTTSHLDLIATSHSAAAAAAAAAASSPLASSQAGSPTHHSALAAASSSLATLQDYLVSRATKEHVTPKDSTTTQSLASTQKAHGILGNALGHTRTTILQDFRRATTNQNLRHTPDLNTPRTQGVVVIHQVHGIHTELATCQARQLVVLPQNIVAVGARRRIYQGHAIGRKFSSTQDLNVRRKIHWLGHYCFVYILGLKKSVYLFL
jgi:hypothetical protein